MLPVGFEERLGDTLYKVKMQSQDFKKALNILCKVKCYLWDLKNALEKP
jgi:hypothetical protein